MNGYLNRAETPPSTSTTWPWLDGSPRAPDEDAGHATSRIGRARIVGGSRRRRRVHPRLMIRHHAAGSAMAAYAAEHGEHQASEVHNVDGPRNAARSTRSTSAGRR